MRASRLVSPVALLLNASALVLLAPAWAAAAQAEQPPQAQASPPAPTASDSGGLEEVLVTARFKSESLQTAPIAITAVTGEQLDARGYVDITQVANIAPNVNLEQAGSGFGKLAFVSIRGIGQSDFKYTFEPGVAFYIDDVYFGTAFGSIFDLTDVDSVEILRGPQGTLFGKNTEGGAVRC
jgi:iron complex outermembrane receptor protein